MALSGIKTFLDPFKVEYLGSWFNIWAPVFKIVSSSFCSNGINGFIFLLQVRNLTTVTGMAVGGNLPAQMNWPGTTANTPGTAPSSARSATEHSPGRTTSPYTWRGTFKSPDSGYDPHCQKRIQYFLPFTLSSRSGEEPNWKALQSWSSSQQVNLWMDNQETEGSQKTNQRTDGVCDWIFYHSNSKPNLNIPGLTNANGVTGSWISGYKLDPRVGGEGRPEFPWIVFRCNISIKITLYSLCLQKPLLWY